MSKKQTKASRKRPDVSPAAPGTEAAAPGGGEARTAPVRPSPAPGRGGRPDRCGPGLPTAGGGGFRTRRRRGNVRSLPGRLGLFF